MSLSAWLKPYVWHHYSRKMVEKIERMTAAGRFTKKEAEERSMRFAEGKEGLSEDGNEVCLTWLVDPSDGMIVDAKFQVFGHSALLIAAQIACEILVGKNYDQAKRLTVDIFDRHVRDDHQQDAFPEECIPHLQLVMSAIEAACEQCLDIPLSPTYVSPVPREPLSSENRGHPNWKNLSKEEKLTIIENVLNEEVRPYVQMDAGGVEVLDLIDDKELLIAYQGTCTSCFSSVGATLNAIQQIIHAKVDGSITVVPQLDDLKFL